MGYLFLGLAVLSNFAKGFCGKMMSGYADNYRKAFFFSFLRMALCLLLGAGILALEGGLGLLAVSPAVLSISLLSGVSTALFCLTWLISARKDTLLMLEVFVMLGMLVTVLLSWIFLQEQPTGLQLLGLALLLIAALVMCSYNSHVKAKLTPVALLLLLLCGLSNGLTDFSQKLFAVHASGTPISVFNFYTFAVCSAVLLLCALGTLWKKPLRGIKAPMALLLKRVGIYIVVMAVALYAHSFCKTQAAGYLSAVQLYPLHQGFALLSTCVMALLFKEKVTVRAIIGLCIAFAGLLLINL